VANQRRLGVLRKQTMKKQLKEEEKGLTKFLFSERDGLEQTS